MHDLLMRLTSRKLWLAVGGFITFVANKQYTEAMAVVLGYLGVEGGADMLRGGGSIPFAAKNAESHNDGEPDKSAIVTGAGRVKSFDEEE